MRKTSPSLPDSYPGLSGSFFIDTSSSGRAGCHPVTPALTFGLEIYTRNHINNREVVLVNMCLQAAAKILTGGWQKTELRAICAEAGLHVSYPLIKKCAISGAARLLDRPPMYPLHSLLPWNRPKAYNLKAGTRNYVRPWTANHGHASYLQIDRIRDNILPLIEDTTQPTRLAKPAIRVHIKQYTL